MPGGGSGGGGGSGSGGGGGGHSSGHDRTPPGHLSFTSSGGAHSDETSVASGDAHATNESVASGWSTADLYSTASGHGVASNGSVASGCSTAADLSTASGDCEPGTHGKGAKGGTHDGAGGPATLARTGLDAGTMAVAAGASSGLGGLLLALGRIGRRHEDEES